MSVQAKPIANRVVKNIPMLRVCPSSKHASILMITAATKTGFRPKMSPTWPPITTPTIMPTGKITLAMDFKYSWSQNSCRSELASCYGLHKFVASFKRPALDFLFHLWSWKIVFISLGRIPDPMVNTSQVPFVASVVDRTNSVSSSGKVWSIEVVKFWASSSHCNLTVGKEYLLSWPLEEQLPDRWGKQL